MKLIFLLLLVPLISQAKFGKPELMARLNQTGAWNAPDNMWCFSSEPGVVNDRVHLGCFDEKGYLMAQWSKEGFKVIARAEQEQMFSHPVSSFGKISWYEFNEFSIIRSFEATDVVTPIEIKNLGPLAESNDSFLPHTSNSFFFKTKGDVPQLWIWRNDVVTSFFNPGASYIFTPQVGAQGEIAFKTRFNDLSENAPDKLWLFDGTWKTILEDTDSDATSPWKTFRHQLSVEGNKVLTIANDGTSDALIIIENKKVTVVARAGVDLKRFDYFAPKMRNGTIVVRGEDFEGRKVTYVHDKDGFRKLLTQGDVVQTDVGAARVHYQSQDAIFYGAPGLDERGNVYLQATLTDADHPRTLLGIGLIKFQKE